MQTNKGRCKLKKKKRRKKRNDKEEKENVMDRKDTIQTFHELRAVNKKKIFL